MMRINEGSCEVVRDEVGGKKGRRTCVCFPMSECGETDGDAYGCSDGESEGKCRLERSTDPPS